MLTRVFLHSLNTLLLCGRYEMKTIKCYEALSNLLRTIVEDDEEEGVVQSGHKLCHSQVNPQCHQRPKLLNV